MISTLLTAVIILIILSTAVSPVFAGVGEFTSISLWGGSNTVLVAFLSTLSTVAIAGVQEHSVWAVAASKQLLGQGKAFASSDGYLHSANNGYQSGRSVLDVQAARYFRMLCGLVVSIAATISDRLIQMSQGTFSTGMLPGFPSVSCVGFPWGQGGIAAFNIDKLTFNPFSAICIQWQSNPTWADIFYQTNRRIAAMGQHLKRAFPYHLFPSKDIKVFPSSKRRVSNDS